MVQIRRPENKDGWKRELEKGEVAAMNNAQSAPRDGLPSSRPAKSGPAGAANAGKWELISLLLLALCLAVSVWKLPYGMATTDEALYLSIPYRLLQGDRLLLHEWHVTQPSSVLLLPLVWLYLRIVGSTEGILLAFRGIYLFFHTLTTAYLYLRLRRRSLPGALCAALMYLIYAPINVPALSYNTMGIGLLAITLLTLALSVGRTWEAVLCGLCFAGAVLCNPYYFVLYLVYAGAVLILALRRTNGAPCLRPAFWLRLTGAGAAVALLVLLYVVLHTELAVFTRTIPAILYGDTAEHPARSLPGILYGIWATFHKNGLFIPTLVVSVGLCLALLLDRNWREHRALYLLIASLLSLCYGFWFRVYYHVSLNFYMFSVNILGFFAWLYADDRRDPLFFFVYLPGLLCWVCSAAASNLGFINISSVSTLNMIASVMLIFSAVPSLHQGGALKKAAATVMILAVVAQFGLLLECRVNTVFPMRPTAAGTEKVAHGSLRGMMAEPEEWARYEDAWAATAPVREQAEGTVAYLTEIPGQYLDDGKRCGVFSAWFPGVSVTENLPRLRLYWEIFPDRIPDVIVIDMEDPAANEILLEGLRWLDYAEQPLGRGFLLQPEH